MVIKVIIFKRKKSVSNFIYILLWLVGLSFSYLSAEAFPPDITSILKRGKLRVAMVAKDQIPFFFHRDGVLAGTDVDLAIDIAKALGVNLEISREAQSFNDLIPLVSEGKVDIVISKLSRTLKRSQQVIFSDPYFQFHQSLAFNRVRLARLAETDLEIKKFVKNFTGKIGVIKGSSYVTYAKLYFPNAEVVEYLTWDDVVKSVIRGDVLAAFRDDFEIKKVLRTNPDLNLSLKLVVLKDLQDNIAMAFNWNSVSLRDFVNIYLSGIKQPTIEEIFIDYDGILSENKLDLE